MDKLDFGESTIGADEWCRLDGEGGNDVLNPGVLVVGADAAPDFLAGPLDSLERIVVTSGDFNDGRFFSIARQIRLLGFRGRLTLVGNILPDQFTALRSCGFDDALILDNRAIGTVVPLDEALGLDGVEDALIRNHTPPGNGQ